MVNSPPGKNRPKTLKQLNLKRLDKTKVEIAAFQYFQYAMKHQMNPMKMFLRFIDMWDDGKDEIKNVHK